jgi:4-carboxymuconolactone decarboxylase
MLLTPAHQTIGETTMSVKTEMLGGRLPLLDPQALSIGQKEIYDRVNTTMIPWADGAHFQSKTDDGRLIGPFNPILFSPDISARFLDLHDHIDECRGESDRQNQTRKN